MKKKHFCSSTSTLVLVLVLFCTTFNVFGQYKLLKTEKVNFTPSQDSKIAKKQCFAINSKTKQQARFTCSLNNGVIDTVQMKDDNVYKKLSFNELTIPGKVGDPNQPTRTELIQVVAGAKVSLVIDSIKWHDVEGDIKLAPFQSLLPDAVGPNGEQPDVNMPFVKNIQSYNEDKFSNQVPVKILGTVRIREHEFVNILYSPISYNPKTGQLRIAYAVNFHLNITLPKQIEKVRADKLNSQNRASLLDARTEEEKKAEAPIKKNEISASKSIGSDNFQPDLVATAADADYLIITVDKFADELAPLAEWKHKKGFKTFIATLTDVGGSTEAAI
jgi:hypothetical protein